MKKYFTFVMVTSLVLSACGGTTTNKISETKNKVENKVGNKLTSIKELLGMGTEQKCEWSTDDGTSRISGKMWIKGNKFRQSILTQTKGSPDIEAEVLTDGEWTYLWNPKTKEQGMKIKMTETEKSENKKLANESLDWGKEYNYNCSPASVSDAEMSPPKDVDFLDLQGLQDDLKKLMPSGVEIPTGE